MFFTVTRVSGKEFRIRGDDGLIEEILKKIENLEKKILDLEIDKKKK